VNAILQILRARTPALLAAPTGRMAKRTREATGLEVRTLHRLLEPIDNMPPAEAEAHYDAALEAPASVA
jgi:hypothetical protein